MAGEIYCDITTARLAASSGEARIFKGRIPFFDTKSAVFLLLVMALGGACLRLCIGLCLYISLRLRGIAFFVAAGKGKKGECLQARLSLPKHDRKRD